MDGRLQQQHQSDSFSIANLLSMQPKHHPPHRPVHPDDPLSHLRKLTSLPDASANATAAETNVLLAIHHQQHHFHPSYYSAMASTASHPPMMTTNSAPEGFSIKSEETMLINTDPSPSASGEQSSTDPVASIDSADSGKLLYHEMLTTNNCIISALNHRKLLAKYRIYITIAHNTAEGWETERKLKLMNVTRSGLVLVIIDALQEVVNTWQSVSETFKSINTQNTSIFSFFKSSFFVNNFEQILNRKLQDKTYPTQITSTGGLLTHPLVY